MLATRLHVKCIIFLASLSLSYSKHISFYVDEIKRMLPQKENCGGVCMTPECVKTAARVISDLDESVDPCDNFYRFACGGWLNSHVIPKGKDSVSVDTTIEDEINMKLKVLFETKLDGTEPAFVKMLKDFYNTCMDEETINKLGVEPLKKDLESLGGWPLVEGNEWNESSFDWVDTLIAFRRLGYDHDMLIYLEVSKDERNSTTNIIKIRAPIDLTEKPLNDSETAAYYKSGVEESVLLGANETTAEKEILEALQFETEIAKLIPKEDDDCKKDEDDDENDVSRKDKVHTAAELKEKKKKREKRDVSGMYSIYTVAELQDLIPEIPWLRYFNGLLNDDIRETENIAVSNLVFLRELASLIKKTEKRVIANYMFVKIVHFSMQHAFPKKDPEDEDKSRDEQCFEEITLNFQIAFNAYFVRHFFKEEDKNAVLEILKYIHRAFLRILEGSDWMDDMTKKEAIEKANSMKTYIGYDKEYLNDTAIMEIYEHLTISNSSYYRNFFNIRKWSTDKSFSFLRRPKIRKVWLSHSIDIIEVNAGYDNKENSIEIPAGQLLNEYFEKSSPHYMNFGGIGWVIGHEITHGFDVDGKKFDKNGNEVDWWDKTTDELYHKRVQCMIDQYSNYTLEDGMKLNGARTIPDNTADNGGVKTAYRAYHSWTENNGPEPLLPGVKYNQRQLFWINFAQTFCEKKTLEVLRENVLEHVHSPSEYRVIGVVSNLPEFSKDFNCHSDSPMNSKNKCHVW